MSKYQTDIYSQIDKKIEKSIKTSVMFYKKSFAYHRPSNLQIYTYVYKILIEIKQLRFYHEKILICNI